MKQMKRIALALAIGTLLSGVLVQADDKKKTEKPKPYILKTCPTDGEKLGSMGKPYVFVHEGREIKLCCDGCLADFKKDPAKYIKKIEEAEKKEKK